MKWQEREKNHLHSHAIFSFSRGRVYRFFYWSQHIRYIYIIYIHIFFYVFYYPNLKSAYNNVISEIQLLNFFILILKSEVLVLLLHIWVLSAAMGDPGNKVEK